MLLWRRECKNPNPDVDVCATYVTRWQTTGIPLIIGLSLFFILAVVLFFIVRRRRRKQHAQEAEKHARIDDGIELEFNAPQEAFFKHGGNRQPQYPHGDEDIEDQFGGRPQQQRQYQQQYQQYQPPTELPPKY